MPGGLHLHRSLTSPTEATSPGTSAPSALARPAPVVPVAVALAVVAAAWALAALTNAAGIPRTDDWGWARVAIELHRTGHVHLVGWGPMTMLGLVAWAQPWLAVLGAHLWVLDLSASVLVAAGLLGAWRLAHLLAGRRGALVVVATVAAAPGFVRDASTFMTDGPAFALATLSLLAGLEAAGIEAAAIEAAGAQEAGRGRRWLLEAACLVCGFWAFSIREPAIAAPLAVLAVRWWWARSHRTRRLALGAELVAFVAAAGAFWAWRSSLPGNQPYGGQPPVFTITEALVGVLFTTSLLLVPVLAATAPSWWRARHRGARLAGMGMGAALALVPIAYAPGSWNRRYQWLTGDYLDPRGINGDKLLLGSRPRIVPAAGWAVIELAAVVAGLVVLGLVAEAIVVAGRSRRGGRDGSLQAQVLVADAILTLGAVATAIARNGAVYDRYLWPVVLAGAVLLVAAFPVVPLWRWHPAAAQVALTLVAAFALVSLLVTLDSDAFDGARWRLANEVVAAGVPAQAVDGGFEWVGWHATAVADANASGDGTRPYWVAMVGEPTACVEVSASPLAGRGATLLRETTWRTWLAFGRANLYAYRWPCA